MKLMLMFSLALVLCAGLLAGCASARHPVVETVSGTNRYLRIHMFDRRQGWAETHGPEGFRVLRTTDGAETWQEVTPKPFPFEAWECEFAKPSTAWISIHTNTWAGLLMTTNGGKSWAKVATPFGYFTEPSDVQFFKDDFAVGRIADFGAGNAFYKFYETRDGGATWKPIDVTAPYPSQRDSGGAIHLCNLCGDRVGYYPPGILIIAYGDSGDETPKGVVRLSLSSDAGKSWREAKLPLPKNYRDCLVVPSSPVFFGARDGLLPVDLFRQDDTSRTFEAALFYRTRDGGNTWTATQPAATNNAVPARCSWNIISPDCIVLRNEEMLQITRDGSRTWKSIQPNIDLGKEGSLRDVAQMSFVDARHGWMVISARLGASHDDHYLLYQTSDGGRKWRELPLKIAR